MGKDPVFGVEYNEIPDGNYLTESIDDATGELPSSDEESMLSLDDLLIDLTPYVERLNRTN